MADVIEQFQGSWADLTDNSVECHEREILEKNDNCDDMPQKSKDSHENKNPENDLRNKLNRSRRLQDEQRPYNRGRRDIYSGRSNCSRRENELSPLRSPIDRSKTSISDMDNSRNHRFSRTQVSQNNSHKSYHCSTQSPVRHPRNKWVVGTDSTSGSEETTPKTFISERDLENGTPVLSRIHSDQRRQSWSRRRLQLPSENEESEGEECEKNSALKEEDAVRLARRDKDILYGKSTDAYKKYIAIIPKNVRSGDMKFHPRTPEKFRKCSRRSWDSQVKIWKRRLHTWAELYTQTADSDKIFDSPKKVTSNVVEAKTSSYSKSDDEDDDDLNLDSDEDDESFLDSMDFNFSVAEVKLHDQ